MQCIVVTPEATIFDEPADFVALPLFDGEIGIAPLHSPMIGRLGYGELRIRQGSQTRRYYVGGGFVEVASDTISILTSRAIPAKNLDPQAIAEQLASARAQQAGSPELLESRDRQVAQARGQLRVASRGHGAAATH